MIQHIVMWKLKEEISQSKKEEVMLEFQKNMHNLRSFMDGVLQVDVIINELDSSNMDMMLIANFSNKEILDTYQAHEKHKAATQCLKGNVEIRSCVDYEMS